VCLCVRSPRSVSSSSSEDWMYKSRVIAVQLECLSEVRLVALRSVLMACPLVSGARDSCSVFLLRLRNKMQDGR
jgi:hypothetical protein